MSQEAAIVEACRRMNALGINQGMTGNISVREGDAMLITPSALPYDVMTEADIVRLPLAHEDGDTLDHARKPSSEWHLHRDVLRARPEYGAVLHAHPRACTALAVARRGVPPFHYMVATFGGGDVRCAPYATFGTAALSHAAVAALDGRHACLLANHGVVVCGRTLDEALARAVDLEATAAQYLASLPLGPVLLTEAEMADARERFRTYRP